MPRWLLRCLTRRRVSFCKVFAGFTALAKANLFPNYSRRRWMNVGRAFSKKKFGNSYATFCAARLNDTRREDCVSHAVNDFLIRRADRSQHTAVFGARRVALAGHKVVG